MYLLELYFIIPFSTSLPHLDFYNVIGLLLSSLAYSFIFIITREKAKEKAREKVREKAREKAREKVREKAREREREREREKVKAL